MDNGRRTEGACSKHVQNAAFEILSGLVLGMWARYAVCCSTCY